jgi:hypothetical protein
MVGPDPVHDLAVPTACGYPFAFGESDDSDLTLYSLQLNHLMNITQ